MRVTPQGFAALTSSIMNIAEACCDRKVVFTLEGGYDLNGLRDSVKAVLREMAGLSMTDHEGTALQANQEGLEQAVKRVIKIHKTYWESLNLAGD
jgi:acetoin utilization deacetylase AcuC-like enzyme